MPDITFLRSNSLENGKQVLSNAEQQCEPISCEKNDLQNVPEVQEPLVEEFDWSSIQRGENSSPLYVDTSVPPPGYVTRNSPLQHSDHQSPPMISYPNYNTLPVQHQVLYNQPVAVPVYLSPMILPVQFMPSPTMNYLNGYLQNCFTTFETAFKKYFTQFWERFQSNWDMNEARSPPVDRSRWMVHQCEAPLQHICKQCGYSVAEEKSKINFWYSFNWGEKAGLLCYKTYSKCCPHCATHDGLVPIWNAFSVDKAMAAVSSIICLNIYGKRQYSNKSSRKSRGSSRTTSTSLCSPQS